MTQSVQCSSCGAPVPLAGAKGQRCFFCLSPVDVPPEIAEVLGDSEQLEARIAQRFRAVEHYRSGIRSQSTAMAGTLGGMIVIAYFGYTPMVQAGLRGDATQSVLFLLSFGLGAAFVFWPPVVWIRAHRRATHRGLCRLPFASVSLTDRIVPSCPNCGSSLKASAALTAVCGSCETESLLPAPLVSSRLQRKHARAVAAHEDFDDAQEEALSARVESQLAFGDSFSTLGKLYFVAVPALCAAYKAAGFLKQGWFEVAGVAVLTGLFAGGFGLFIGHMASKAVREEQKRLKG